MFCEWVAVSDKLTCGTELNVLEYEIEELKVLQGFPKSFKLKGTFAEKWGQIGNSVPPPLTYRIGKTIINEILNKSL